MQEYFNSNEHRKYPFRDDSVPGLLDAVVADLRITLTGSLGTPFLSRLELNGMWVSAIFSVSGQSVAAVTVSVSDIDNHKYGAFALEPLHPGAAGWIVFGSGLSDIGPVSVAYESEADGGLASGAFSLLEPPGVSKFMEDPDSGREGSVSGDVEIRGRSGVTVRTAGNKVILGLDKATRQALLPFSDSGAWTPRLRSILGVCPDEDDTITLVFR